MLTIVQLFIYITDRPIPLTFMVKKQTDKKKEQTDKEDRSRRFQTLEIVISNLLFSK